ncbi:MULTISPECIES: HNH endonuclease signature motif containing protein [unclassified Microbacterium]|uniref:HNH endonuclease signature motif containing protein n=1 Tax=unclassified Microbacterium TaxID=2609290 RepID=UPI000CFF2B61|nr:MULTISPECIES: HNH endonuclease signature motif containing protein [unclassified Microbacterium]PRB59946.1 HNH endonuclease [Microbacterium sp. MYb45]
MAALVDATVEQVGTLAELTDMLVGLERTISSLQAARDGVLAVGSRLALQVADEAEHPDFGDLTTRTVAAEMAAALRVSDRTVQARMTEAVWRVERFPLVWAAQGAGRISAAHARAICDAAEHLEDAADRDAYSAEMVPFAESESPNRVSRHGRRVAERFQSRSVDERHKDAREKRSVWVKDVGDGMSQLGLLGPAALVHGAFERLTQMAQGVQEQGEAQAQAPSHEPESPEREDVDQRTVAQLRADLALDLLLTGAPAGHDTPEGLLAAIQGAVSVTVPVTTLMGHGTTPAELDGRTPIDTGTAKALAGAASGWDRILTHPITGALLAVDRYRPGSELKRHLRARDQRCRFPACGYAARDCDIDHHHDAARGGPTVARNLGHLCRRHHVLKHHSPWVVEVLGDGAYAWTSPTGRVYVDREQPQNTVTFVEDHALAPF